MGSKKAILNKLVKKFIITNEDKNRLELDGVYGSVVKSNWKRKLFNCFWLNLQDIKFHVTLKPYIVKVIENCFENQNIPARRRPYVSGFQKLIIHIHFTIDEIRVSYSPHI